MFDTRTGSYHLNLAGFRKKYKKQASFHRDTDIHPYSYEERSVLLDFVPNDFLPLMKYVELERFVTIDAWGYLRVHEVHSLQVNSPNPEFANTEQRWENITLVLPPGSEFLRVYDQVANLSSSIGKLANITHPGKIYLSFQFHLEEDDIYTFHFEYRIPLDLRQVILQTGQFLFLGLYLEYPFRIQNQITEFFVSE